MLEQAQATVTREQARGAEREQQLLVQVAALREERRAGEEQLAQLSIQLCDELQHRQQLEVQLATQRDTLREARQEMHGLNINLKHRRSRVASLRVGSRYGLSSTGLTSNTSRGLVALDLAHLSLQLGTELQAGRLGLTCAGHS
ncbi:hypothetical protein D3C84_638810 [compost metagenome]